LCKYFGESENKRKQSTKEKFESCCRSRENNAPLASKPTALRKSKKIVESEIILTQKLDEISKMLNDL
jgi:hypothetical protein